jgi:predicted PurR-regulated permease PerM
MPWLTLSERQKSTVGTALTMFSGLFMLAVAVGAFVFVLRFLTYFSGVLMPLAVAAVVALVTRPYFEWLVRRARIPAVALVLYFISVLIPLGAFLWFFGSILFMQIADLLARIPGWLSGLTDAVQAHMPALHEYIDKHDLDVKLREAFAKNMGVLVAGAQSVAVQVFGAGASVFRSLAGLLSWLILPVYLSFLLLMKPFQARNLEPLLPFLRAETRKDVVYLAEEFTKIIVSFFRGQLTVAFIQGLMYATAFALVGVPYGLAIGLLMGVLNVVPYLGSAVGLVLSVLLSWAKPEGGGLAGIGFALGAFGVVQVIESYFITPRIMGKSTGLHPMTIMVAMFFWGTALGGIMGILLAVPLTAFLVVLWRLLKAKYIREIV